jgi:hypothetical protein
MIIKFSSKRQFQVWAYTVSHGQLLLRSTKTEEMPTRIDILFKPVSFMELPTLFHGITVCEVESGDADGILGRIQASEYHIIYKHQKVYKLSSGDVVAYVVASAFVVHEDDGEYYDRSALFHQFFSDLTSVHTAVPDA